jgi:hypothetical protein
MPCTLAVPVVLAGATAGPVCSGTPSNPTFGCDALDVEVAPEVPAALEVLVAAALDVPVPALELELELEPQAARVSAHNSAVARPRAVTVVVGQRRLPPPKSDRKNRKTLKTSRKIDAAIGTAPPMVVRRRRLKSNTVNAPKIANPATA